MRIACLGPEGTFSEEAAVGRFPTSEIHLVEPGDGAFQAIFDLVESGECGAGLVPFYNFHSGRDRDAFRRVYRALAKGRVAVGQVIVHPIEWCAISHADLDSVSRMHSFDEGLAQCKEWLEQRSPPWEIVRAKSTAAAAQAANADRESAALASRRAAEKHGVPIRLAGVKQSRTWFYVLSPALHVDHAADCCTLIASPISVPVSQVFGQAEVPGQLTIPRRDGWIAKPPDDDEGGGDLEFLEVALPHSDPLTQKIANFMTNLRGNSRIVGCFPAYDVEEMVCGKQCEKK